MKDRSRRVAVAIYGFARSRPKECRWSIYGFVVGALLGAFFIGGVGIAALGSAVGASAWAILGFIGLLIGNRVGTEKDKPAPTKEAAH
jgi:hypothetical protein